MKRILFLLILVNIFSCSPEKRLGRLVKNHPELISRDTIFRVDTTIVNGVQHDTIFKNTITRDTLVIKDHQLTIKYFNDGKTTYLKGICDTVWAIKEIPIQVNSIEAKISNEKWWEKGLKYINLLILAVLLILLFKR